MDNKFLNIGCGNNFHNDWINIDISPRDVRVKKEDITIGLSNNDSSIDFCYSSHVLEHLTTNQASRFISECKRVLKPNGVLRLAVPDLERITRDYLAVLERVRRGDECGREYEWLLLELLDQTTRTKSGGAMINYLNSMDENETKNVVSRIGYEASNYLSLLASPDQPLSSKLYQFIKKNIGKFRRHIAATAVFFIAGNKSRQNYLIGEFRGSGEIHQWMYDEYSLGKIMRDAGFIKVKKFSAGDSYAPNFKKYNLEVKNGHELKPDSLYMEGIKG